MSNDDYFNFENEDRDFPFYKKNPYVPKSGWIVLIVASIVALLFTLMGEELIKFVPFMLFLRILYKYSNNRKLSVVVSMLIVMVFFALLHAMDFRSLFSVLVLQVLGSIFEFIGYIKTKNIMVSYITHLCTDVFIFALIMMGVA